MSAVLEALKRAEEAIADLRAAILAEGAPKEAPAPPSRLLSLQDYKDAAKALGVPLVTVQAVDEVESGMDGGFDSLNRPTVLFEPHVFSKRTGRRFDDTHGGVSYRVWRTKPYPTGSEDERNAANWAKIEYAARLDHDAAYESASYGRFQVMGFNWKTCGFPSVDAFVEAMKRSERDHLMAFIAYVKANDLAKHLVSGDWEAFAAGYNGPGNAKAYGAKIAAAVARRLP